MPMVMFDLKSTLKWRPTLSKINKRIKHNATLEAGLGIYFITVFIFAYIQKDLLEINNNKAGQNINTGKKHTLYYA